MRNLRPTATKKQNEKFNEVTKHFPIKFQEIIKDSLKYGRIIRSDEHYHLVKENKQISYGK